MLTKRWIFLRENGYKMKNKKEKLIQDIQNLLNSYQGESLTSINPKLLEYMDENDLKRIIEDLLIQKENLLQNNKQWLEQFKKVEK